MSVSSPIFLTFCLIFSVFLCVKVVWLSVSPGSARVLYGFIWGVRFYYFLVTVVVDNGDLNCVSLFIESFCLFYLVELMASQFHAAKMLRVSDANTTFLAGFIDRCCCGFLYLEASVEFIDSCFM